MVARLITAHRFVFTPAELGAALSLGRLVPSTASSLPGLAPSTAPLQTLQRHAALEGDELSLEALSALYVAANPAQLVTVTMNRAGETEWKEICLLRSADESPYVIQAITAEHVDLTLLPTTTQAALVLDDMLELSSLPSRPGAAPITLSLGGYATALALSDFLLAAELEDRLKRRGGTVRTVSMPELTGALALGLHTPDTRWAVTAGGPAAAIPLAETIDRVDSGIQELCAARWLVPIEGGRYAPTLLAIEACTGLRSVVVTAGMRLVAAVAPTEYAAAQITLFRSAASIWIATWSEVGDGDARATFAQYAASGALGVLHAMLDPDPGALGIT